MYSLFAILFSPKPDSFSASSNNDLWSKQFSHIKNPQLNRFMYVASTHNAQLSKKPIFYLNNSLLLAASF